MKTIFLAGRLLSLVAVIIFSISAAGAQAADAELTVEDRRQIIEVLLTERFANADEKTIFISKTNLSDDLLKVFPTVKNKQIRFVSKDEAAATGVCAFEFGDFQTIGKFVSVSFGDCSEGMAYDFKKYGEKWKSVGLTIVK
ncbi:MAG: hypothetical protein JSS81_12945 [Acidobacteria bacterium]|nr:hypothetical protein [Acidobacteriota bacterium]